MPATQIQRPSPYTMGLNLQWRRCEPLAQVSASEMIQKPQQLIFADELELHSRMQGFERPYQSKLTGSDFQDLVTDGFQPL